MRLLPLLLVIPLLTTFAPLSLAREPAAPEVPRIVAEPVALFADAPDRRRLGALRFVAGWWLRSNDPRFGGVSALHVEGDSVTALTDGGRLYRFAVPTGRGPAPLWTDWLGGRKSAGKKEMRDTEALVIAGDNAWASFERQNAVRRYDRDSWRIEATAEPPAMRDWRANAGAEAMVRLRDGRFLVFAEGRSEETGTTPVLLFDGDPTKRKTAAAPLSYRPPAGFRITDAALLPGGRLLILNRGVSLLDGFQVKMVMVEKSDLRAGAVIAGREIAQFAGEVTTDNYEGLAITREDGRTILWIASDDNFMAFQRTLLMKFVLEG